jgi:hypothetical protein
MRTLNEQQYQADVESLFHSASGSFQEKMQAFPRFVSRQQQAIYLYKWELFKQILDVHGSIFEFGVYMGSGLFSFANFSSILEPFNYQRKIVGFDTFDGFPDIDTADLKSRDPSEKLVPGGFRVGDDLHDQLQRSIEQFDTNRPIGHVQKVELVKGDIMETLPKFISDNPHTLISLLYLDLDLYKPTKLVLELLYDRIVPGGIIAFDELNNQKWPGETTAYLEFFKGRGGSLKKMHFEPLRSYFVKEVG